MKFQYFKSKLLTEGGANAHLSHLFEDGKLTFAELYDIFAKVFSGKIELREKIDGFAFTVTMRNGVLYSARNKTELKSPLNFEQTIQKFADRPPVIKNAFITSFADMNTALQALSKKEQNNIFGNGKNFLSFEIVSPGAKNIVNYGSKAIIVLHGINIYDQNWIKTSDDPAKAKLLFDYFEKHNVLNQKTYAIQGPVVLKIKNAPKAADALNELKTDINDILDGLPSNTTLLKFVIAKIQPKLQDIAVKSGIGRIMTDVVVADLISRSGNSLGLRPVAITDVISHIADNAFTSVSKGQIKSFITNINEDVTSLIDQVSMPIWMLVVKAGILLIKCLDGFIAADQSQTANELSAQLTDILNTDVKSQLSPGNLARFSKALQRLDVFNREVFGTEGVVFTYKDKLYKLTSTFGPLNQLIGLFNRLTPNQNRQSPAEESTDNVSEADDDVPTGKMPQLTTEFNKNFEYVIFIPGSFKPPHIGHINMIRAYANKAFGISSLVKVIISDPVKAKRTLDDGQVITAEAAKAALEFVLDKLSIRNVEFVISNNPLKWIMDDIVQNADAFKHKMVIIGMSSKDGSAKYDHLINSAITYMHDNDINQAPNEQTIFVAPSASMIEPIANAKSGTINATDLRAVLTKLVANEPSHEQIIKALRPFLPRTLSDVDILTYFKYLHLT